MLGARVVGLSCLGGGREGGEWRFCVMRAGLFTCLDFRVVKETRSVRGTLFIDTVRIIRIYTRACEMQYMSTRIRLIHSELRDRQMKNI